MRDCGCGESGRERAKISPECIRARLFRWRCSLRRKGQFATWLSGNVAAAATPRGADDRVRTANPLPNAHTEKSERLRTHIVQIFSYSIISNTVFYLISNVIRSPNRFNPTEKPFPIECQHTEKQRKTATQIWSTRIGKTCVPRAGKVQEFSLADLTIPISNRIQKRTRSSSIPIN